ncbi:MAG TPA: prepilin-type N-terminal cleavage/methylation domain-containing protein [Alphaproteobacteria bacterium]|nr:prepilin-type N-terminal cleavage/methylation domain-containing protein [Alphaproteobacteria bacterium]
MTFRIRKTRDQRGFTLIEMIIVVAIILILVAIAVPVYTQHVLHAREAVLKEDLYTLRNAIDQYSQDKERAPQSLDDLVSAGYLRVLPKDPFTRLADWDVVQEDIVQSVDQTQPGISDVHSHSALRGSDGTPYSSW